MNTKKLFSSLWMRVLVFFWVIIFPIVFIALPALEMAWKEEPFSFMPIWAFVVWVLSPLVVSIVLRNMPETNNEKIDET